MKRMKLCVRKLDDTLSQNTKDGGPSWFGDFRGVGWGVEESRLEAWMKSHKSEVAIT